MSGPLPPLRPNPYPGKLIAVEGVDGSGKSTQLYLLKRWLEQSGCKVFFTEWNSSVLVSSATKKAKKRHLLTPVTFSLIHATDLADRYERQILPLLQGGFLVLADRYVFTGLARDAARGMDRQWVREIYDFAVMPDLTLFFNAPLEVALARILEGRPELKYFEAGMDLGLHPEPTESFKLFQGMIHKEYQKLAGEMGFAVINSDKPVEEMQLEVRDIVRARIPLQKYKSRQSGWRRMSATAL